MMSKRRQEKLLTGGGPTHEKHVERGKKAFKYDRWK